MSKMLNVKLFSRLNIEFQRSFVLLEGSLWATQDPQRYIRYTDHISVKLFYIVFLFEVTVSPFLKLPWVNCSNNEKRSKKGENHIYILFCILAFAIDLFIKQGKCNSINKKESHLLKTLTLLIRTDSYQSIRKYSMLRWKRKMNKKIKRNTLKLGLQWKGPRKFHNSWYLINVP